MAATRWVTPVIFEQQMARKYAALIITRDRLRAMLEYATGNPAVCVALGPTEGDMLRVIRAGGRMTPMEVALATGRSYDTVVHYITRLQSSGVHEVEAARRGTRKGVYLPPKYEYADIA